MRIITISREFGSGGRELGKRLSDILGLDYYDREIIASIAKDEQLDAGFVEKTLEEQAWMSVPYTFRRSFSITSIYQPPQVGLLQAQRKVICGIADIGRDCIIVGRNADVFLGEHRPLKIFVCASLDARVERCMERAPENERMTRRQVEQNIRRIDKNRASAREIIASGRWGDAEQYDLTVNTTGWDIKNLAPAVASFAQSWFSERQI